MNKLARLFLRPSFMMTPRYTRLAVPRRYFSTTADEKFSIKVDMQAGKLTQETTSPAVSPDQPTTESNPSYVCKL